MPAMLEDPTAPAIYRTSGRPPYPTPSNPQIPDTIIPRHVTLRDRITIASLIPFSNPADVPPRLLSYLCSQLNLEIEKGDTYPMMQSMPVKTFGTYWFQNFGAIMLLGEVGSTQDVAEIEARGERWEEACLGSFYVKPNYPGRSSHVCNGGFLVTEAARNRGVGRLMGEGYLEWAPKLGYTYSVFNLVYETNVASCRIWDALGFKRIGRIKSCGNLRSHPDDLVDAIIYGRDLGPEGEDFVSEERFDKIRYYLKHGTYPSGADRAEKSRLRSAATHYKLLPDENGQGERLMLKDKEVVSDPQRQYEIARNVHAQQHGGINKTTATIAERFHWVRIKETVSLVIKNCTECKETAAKALNNVRAASENNGSATHQLRKAAGACNGQGGDPNSMIERLVHFDQMASPPSHVQNPSSPHFSPNTNHQSVPVANMHTFNHQEHQQYQPHQQHQHTYNNIPLDPQITNPQHQYQHYHTPSRSPTQSYSTAHPPSKPADNTNPYTDLEMEDPSSMPAPKLDQVLGDDTRMATERHVRAGDEPMAYQDGRGVVHHGGRIDGDTGAEDGDVGKTNDIDLEEMLSRG